MSQQSPEAEMERLKKQLGLVHHLSGYGAFREMFKGDREVVFTSPTSHDGPRSTATSIYFLLTQPHCVTWHKHLSDEGFYWHAGGKVKVRILTDGGTLSSVTLGDVVRNEDCMGQAIVPHDTWYCAELQGGAAYALYSAVVTPGFEFRDWIAGEREAMLKAFPQHHDVIIQFT
ncbi:uncharacterized protein LOC127837548 isoform X2 [Dreissena polymorpha]|uniref:DUF985 domain-containing protein n=2 Tax=Dreissena polymorpha TaxID=45954 RepID=A0A9D4FAR5_DREPO|nr:uncharacterized protein LOC127837548 isoform X2 [Dreissena polymorpha]XP_052220699.1 uncharacterized protein LOC127837548 isoform X2 [Dreissena polymorpha]KAH3794401.1 hypothetical protein DPMN_147934 [Dreissena polymorpha]